MKDNLLVTSDHLTPFDTSGVDIHEQIRARTRDLALKAGRVPPHVLQVDYEQAKQELIGKRQTATFSA
jgi:hypothetical protein